MDKIIQVVKEVFERNCTTVDNETNSFEFTSVNTFYKCIYEELKN